MQCKNHNAYKTFFPLVSLHFVNAQFVFSAAFNLSQLLMTIFTIKNESAKKGHEIDYLLPAVEWRQCTLQYHCVIQMHSRYYLYDILFHILNFHGTFCNETIQIFLLFQLLTSIQ